MNRILSLKEIEESAEKVLGKYDVKSCILFGSYARGEATAESDVDLAIEANVKGLAFFGIQDDLEDAFQRKVDLLTLDQIRSYAPLESNFKRDGIVIYGKRKADCK